MLSIVAARPASARSRTSPPARGRSRTRSPALNSRPATARASSGVRSSSRCHSHSFMFPSPQRAMHFQKLFGGQHFAAIENLACPFVAFAHLPFLIVGQREDAERQDFVDLRSVEEVARTFRRDLRIVIENDRR